MRIGYTLACLTVCVFWTAISLADNLDDEIKALEGFTKTYQLIQSRYIDHRNAQQLIRSAIEGMVRELDPYSEAIDREEMEKLKSDASGRFVGIGISIQKREDHQVVTQVVENSPAEKAGFKIGDVVITVDNVNLSGLKETEIFQLVRGEVGSQMIISFYHPDKPDLIIRKPVTRAEVNFPSVVVFEAEPDIIVLEVRQFQKTTADEIEDALNKKPYAGVLMDLRNNPGGVFLAAVETAELFINGGDIVETRDRQNHLIERYVSRRKETKSPPRLVVMMNRFSASSAEIVAGAIKDRKVGLIVGEKSYGKGVVQTVFPLGDDLFIKLTTARYVTPSGVSFHKLGIEPDHPVADIVGITRYGSEDQVYAAALNLIKRLD